MHELIPIPPIEVGLDEEESMKVLNALFNEAGASIEGSLLCSLHPEGDHAARIELQRADKRWPHAIVLSRHGTWSVRAALATLESPAAVDQTQEQAAAKEAAAAIEGAAA